MYVNLVWINTVYRNFYFFYWSTVDVQYYVSCCCSLVCCVWLFVTPWTTACQASLSFTISQSMPKFLFIEFVMPFNHLSPSSPALNLSKNRFFSNESVWMIYSLTILSMALLLSFFSLCVFTFALLLHYFAMQQLHCAILQ